MSGVLTAKREGPQVKLTMEYPDGFDHAFMVERLDGKDDNGNEMWAPIHTGTAKFVQGDTDFDYSPPAGRCAYRALAYRNAEPDSKVLILHTEGAYTDPVTV